MRTAQPAIWHGGGGGGWLRKIEDGGFAPGTKKAANFEQPCLKQGI